MSVLKGSWKDGFLVANGINFHYVTQGEGQLMLMLHGFPEFWYSWRYQIPEFAKDYKVVALDLRGYNESDKPKELAAYAMTELLKDVAGVITGLGYESCILVGHDWGGAIAWKFAYTYPQMVDKLIVMNIPHPAKFIEGLYAPQQLLKSSYIFFFQLPFLPEWTIQANDYQLFASAFSEIAIDKNIFTQADLEAYKDAAAKRGALTAMLNYYRYSFQKYFQKPSKKWEVLEIPTLMIWGENDRFLGKELTYGTENYVKNLTIKYIPNCSHWVQQEQPELVSQYMQEFLSIFI
jgi:pimeloyl-ACP methyl ester carboxylesterase